MASKGKRNTGKGKGSKTAAAGIVSAIASKLERAEKGAVGALRARIEAGERIANRGKGVTFQSLAKQLAARYQGKKDAKGQPVAAPHGISAQPLNYMAQVHMAYVAPKTGAVSVEDLAALGAAGVTIAKLQAWAKVAEAKGPKTVLETLRKDPTAKPPRASSGNKPDRVLISLTSTEDVATFRSLAEGDEKPTATLQRLMAEIVKRRAADTPATRKGGSKRERATLPDRPQA